AIELVDYQWLLFYPCLYFFVMWDAFRDAGGGKSRHSYLPFVFAAYIMTLGVIYSSISIWGDLFCPVWLLFLSFFPRLMLSYLGCPFRAGLAADFERYTGIAGGLFGEEDRD